jgi:hypothetical protein
MLNITDILLLVDGFYSLIHSSGSVTAPSQSASVCITEECHQLLTRQRLSRLSKHKIIY